MSESLADGQSEHYAIIHSYDSNGRRTNLELQRNTATELDQTFTYDTASRLATAATGAVQAQYSYLEKSSLISQINYVANGMTIVTTAKTYDQYDRLESISTDTALPSHVSGHRYTYNNRNQRTEAEHTTGRHAGSAQIKHDEWIYGYNTRGEVVSGKKQTETGVQYPGRDFNYTYDDIGNRTQTTINGRGALYTANLLNQYTQRGVPAAIDIRRGLGAE